MTESEASTILKAEIIHHPECSIFAEALGIAIQALEKQMPMKVRYEDVGYEQYGKLKVCGQIFTGEDIIRYSYKWCYNCGQRVDFTLPRNRFN